MTSNQKYLSLAILLLPGILFGISLTKDGFSYQYLEVETVSSSYLLSIGGFAFIGGGLFETLIWLANPIALFAVIRFFMENNTKVTIDPVLQTVIPKKKPNSYWLAGLAAIIAWSFSLWNEVLAAESGTMGKILTLESGYWLWVSSFTLLAIGLNFYHFRIRK